tara:strand:+ start:2003 stop:2803 length:801 start_codon:yes stop_codon:yes gene_type:complete
MSQKIGIMLMLFGLVVAAIKTNIVDFHPPVENTDGASVAKVTDKVTNLIGYGAGLMLLSPALIDVVTGNMPTMDATVALGMFQLILAMKQSGTKLPVPFLPSAGMISVFASVVCLAALYTGSTSMISIAATVYVIGFMFRQIVDETLNEKTAAGQWVGFCTSTVACLLAGLAAVQGTNESKSSAMILALVMLSRVLDDAAGLNADGRFGAAPKNDDVKKGLAVGETLALAGAILVPILTRTGVSGGGNMGGMGQSVMSKLSDFVSY